ncbi:nickel transport protein [Rhodobacter aestuarii]|uniref:Nickel transport protein n=1 Tax=Rhodobacter aestuarii TaxID=453582 RepID=A0A1N7KZZ6_9RHOB|nr:cobalamin biosynthesis protein CbiL [Rhodobacter aestuarii]PTV95473.1 nickel transport protein [Rhodobacter aestuarii]SIS67154.1 nickel transport protein [Rhodobacter aestuarii]
MTRLTLLPLTLIATMAIASPAAAHGMKVFAKVVGGEVSGYGFFIGGGRPQGVAWQADMGATALAEGQTDAMGAFAFAAPKAVTAPVIITLNTGDGHIARATLGPERFGAAPVALPAQQENAPSPAAPAPEVAAPDVAALVEAAVAREVAPLMERLEQMDNRMRVTDLMSGIFLIIGLAGMALWARGRRK